MTQNGITDNAHAKLIGSLVADCDMLKVMINELNDDLIRLMQERNAARAEAAAAEREAIALDAEQRAAAIVDDAHRRGAFAPEDWVGRAAELREFAAAIRARGTQHATPDGIDDAAGQALR